jgi:hypothetical protein
MYDYLGKYIKKYLLVSAIVFILSFMFFVNMYSFYNGDFFEVMINGQNMRCYYKEQEYVLGFSTAGTNAYVNSDQTNYISQTSQILLQVNEYEVYYKNGNRKKDTTGWLYNENLIYKETENDKYLIIKRNNEIIYSGNYRSDLTAYLQEKGRYYIHIYVNRKENAFSKVKTHIALNVRIGD